MTTTQTEQDGNRQAEKTEPEAEQPTVQEGQLWNYNGKDYRVKSKLTNGYNFVVENLESRSEFVVNKHFFEKHAEYLEA